MTGNGRLDNWNDLQFAGKIEGLNLRQAAAMTTPRQIPWNGTLAGTFEARTNLKRPDAIVKARLDVAPAPEGDPITGHIDVTYDQVQGTIALGSSSIATPATRVELDGTLGRTLRVRARTTRLEDIIPAWSWLKVDRLNSP